MLWAKEGLASTKKSASVSGAGRSSFCPSPLGTPEPPSSSPEGLQCPASCCKSVHQQARKELSFPHPRLAKPRSLCASFLSSVSGLTPLESCVVVAAPRLLLLLLLAASAWVSERLSPCQKLRTLPPALGTRTAVGRNGSRGPCQPRPTSLGAAEEEAGLWALSALMESPALQRDRGGSAGAAQSEATQRRAKSGALAATWPRLGGLEQNWKWRLGLALSLFFTDRIFHKAAKQASVKGPPWGGKSHTSQLPIKPRLARRGVCWTRLGPGFVDERLGCQLFPSSARSCKPTSEEGGLGVSPPSKDGEPFWNSESWRRTSRFGAVYLGGWMPPSAGAQLSNSSGCLAGRGNVCPPIQEQRKRVEVSQAA